MSDSQRDRVSAFRVEGKFLGFAVDGDGTPKYLQLEVETGQLSIKLAKQSRFRLGLMLQPDDRIEVFGEKKLKYKTGEFRLKAAQVNKLTANSDNYSNNNIENVQVRDTPPCNGGASSYFVKIVACYKSGCLKKGGSRLLSDLERALRDRGLSDRVVIETTGCLKRCSQAPNLLLKPGNIRLNGMTPEAIATLLDQVAATPVLNRK